MAMQQDYSKEISSLKAQMQKMQTDFDVKINNTNSGIDYKLLQTRLDIISDYPEIINKATSGIGNLISKQSVLITCLSILIPALVGLLGRHFLRKVKKNLKKIGEQKKDIEDSIIGNRNKIYISVRESLVKERFERLKERPEDWVHLSGLIASTPNSYISDKKNYYDILVDIASKNNLNSDYTIAIIYQFFPYQAYKDDVFKDRRFWNGSARNYGDEILF